MMSDLVFAGFATILDVVQHPYFTLSGWLVGLIGLVATLLSFRRKQLCYELQTYTVFQDASDWIEGLRVTFGRRPIKQLKASILTIWNAGSAVIGKVDIAPMAPLEVFVDGDGEVLNLFVEEQSRIGNNFTVSASESKKNTYTVTFDYIGQKEWCTIVILHTCKAAEVVRLRGEVIGGAEIRYKQMKSINFILVYAIIMITLSGTVGLGTVYIRALIRAAQISGDSQRLATLTATANSFYLALAAGILFLLIGLVLLVVRVVGIRPRRHGGTLLPSSM